MGYIHGAGAESHALKSGDTIKVVDAYDHPDLEQSRQVAGMPSRWIHLGGDWRRLDLYCNRVRFLFGDAIKNAAEFSEPEFLELIKDCLDSADMESPNEHQHLDN